MSSPRTRGADPAAPPRPRLARVEKRDGRQVPFDLRKIEAAVHAAARAAQDVGAAEDPVFAAEVASVVELTLLDRASALAGHQSEWVPHIEEIQDLVEAALVELGRTSVAKAYILYRDRRARVRDALRVEPGSATAPHRERVAGTPAPADGPRDLTDHAEGTRLRVREAEGTGSWSKGRIVASLMEEAELARDTAEEVAARVERRVFASGLQRVTTALVRELVAGELLDLGLAGALRRQGLYGVPRADLLRLLRDPRSELSGDDPAARDAGLGSSARLDPQPSARRAAQGVDRRVSAQVLRRFALDEVLGEGIADLHLGGDLHVEDLGAPHLPLTLSLPAELVVPGEPHATSAFELPGAAAELLRGVSRGVVLEEPGPILAPLARATSRSSPDRVALGLGALLRSLAAVARASGRTLGLGSPGLRYQSLTPKLVVELAGVADDPFAPSLYLAEDELEALDELAVADPVLEDALELGLARGRIVPTFGGQGASGTYAAPGCRRAPRERGALACGGAVALNLARLARRAGPWREDTFLTSLADLVRCAVEAASRLHAFQVRDRVGSPLGIAMRTSFALVPVGLREALRVLGDGEIDPARGARLLGLVADAGARFGAASGGEATPPLELATEFGEEASVRLARLDQDDTAATGTRNQRWLFADAELRREAGSGPGGAYSSGFPLSPVRGLFPGQAEAECLRTVATGSLRFARGILALDQADPSAQHPHLAAWRRFREVSRHRGTGDNDVLFPAVHIARGARPA